MAKRKNVNLKKVDQSGFSLMEVMIAITIFAVFITAFMTSSGYNLSDSIKMKEQIKLRVLCENKMNEITLSPPELTESLTVSADTKTFEKEPNYQYKVTWKKFFVPDYDKVNGKSGNDKSPGEDNANENMLEKQVFDNMKKNLEKMLWQVEVEVSNKTDRYSYTLTNWITNKEASIEIPKI